MSRQCTKSVAAFSTEYDRISFVYVEDRVYGYTYRWQI